MDSRREVNREIGALTLLDDAVHLLRFTPVPTWVCYLLGTLPFVLGLLFFCADMSSSPTASHHLVETSLGLTFLYLWMKCWQAVFCIRLRTLLHSDPDPHWTFRRIVQTLCVQTAIIPWKIIVLPVAALVTLPFGWCYAFFQNIACADNRSAQDLRTSVRHAWNQALMWPKQNHLILLILSLYSLIVFANLCVAAYSIPTLMKSLLGVESVLSRSNLFLMNSTFWLSMAALTYLCVNPLVHAVYVIRCREGAALSSGEDLLLELSQLGKPVSRALIGLLILLQTAMAIPANAESALGSPTRATRAPIDSRSAIPPHELDTAITEVMQRIEFTWKLPKGEDNEPKEDSEAGFVKRAWQTLRGWIRAAWNWLVDTARWLLEHLERWLPRMERESSPSDGGPNSRRFWLSMMLVPVIGIAIYLARRHYRMRRSATRHDGIPHEPIQPEPDLNSDEVLADGLPESSWLTLADACLARGDLRLALRAFHLGALSHLSSTGLIGIARSKSNWEYMTELKRRAHALPGLLQAFSSNTQILEKAWYGHHTLDQDVLELYITNHKRIMADVQGQ